MSAPYDVAIVGFGPSGAVAAGLLGLAGHRVFVAEKLRGVYDKPRAIALDHEIMRLFQQLGLSEKIEQWIAPFRPSEYYGVDRQLIKRLDTVAPPYPLGYTPTLVFSQPPVETALREHVAALPSVEVALGAEVADVNQNADAVNLSLRQDDGATRIVAAKYCIACDGASSFTRQAFGLDLEDLNFDEPWLVVDVLVNHKGLARLPDVCIQYCDPERPCTYIIGPGNHRRWEISLRPGEDPQQAASEAGTWRLLQRWITPDDARLWRQASYRFHALVAREWRKGRVFLAGDAAHQQPPFIGQGMCQGLRDASNLAWKLDAVLGGRASEELLDTYGPERGRHVRELTTRLKKIGAIVCERDPEAARRRDAALLAETGGVVRTTTRQDIIPPLETGLLSAGAGTARGTLFPQPWIEQRGQRQRLDALCGHGWRVVIDAAAASPGLDLPAAIVERLKLQVIRIGEQGDALREADGVVREWFQRHGAWAAIVRPDHYVYGTAPGAGALRDELEGLVARL